MVKHGTRRQSLGCYGTKNKDENPDCRIHAGDKILAIDLAPKTAWRPLVSVWQNYPKSSKCLNTFQCILLIIN